ncbi:MAG: hypothetical protein IJ661_07085 [Lachnospiraceae bacterium]|nr:hypothetical protein [Lachnospiraceae bacterium]
MSNISGNAFGAAAAYQQTNSWWNKGGKSGTPKTAEARREERLAKAEGKETGKTDSTGKSQSAAETSAAAGTEKVTAGNNVKTSVWSNKGVSQAPVPSYNKDYGVVIGDVSLSKEASDYYNKLKAKYGGMEFVLVSKDQKAAVQANVSKYGNAKKPVVLIDDEKLERMATDKDFREKYEGIISMAQNQLASMKNDLSSSGAAIKNFGMSVNADGSTDYFAVMEKSNKQQAERIEKKRAEKAEARKEAKKADAKKLEQKRADKKEEARKLDKKRADKKAEEKRAERKDKEDRLEAKHDVRSNKEDRLEAKYGVRSHKADKSNSTEGIDETERVTEARGRSRAHRSYTEFSSSSLEDLVSAVRSAAYTQSLGSVQTAAEKTVGQSIDFKG